MRTPKNTRETGKTQEATPNIDSSIKEANNKFSTNRSLSHKNHDQTRKKLQDPVPYTMVTGPRQKILHCKILHVMVAILQTTKRKD